MTKKRIALLSNVTVDLIVGRLKKEYDLYIPEGFDTWIQETFNSAARIYSEKLDAVILLLDGTEARSWKTVGEGAERIDLWKQALNALTTHFSDIPIFVSTVDIRENRIKTFSERRYKYEFENDWYQYLQGLVESRKNVYIIDLADTIAEIGRKQFYSNKMWYMSSMPYSRDGLILVVSEIKRALEAVFVSRKKIIALDLDNTLWGGVIGEDGIDGINLSDHKEGQRYYDFQRQILEMKNRGIILGIVSKNNEADVENTINNHSAMLLRDEDFVSKKINWDNKAINLKLMEKELNLSESGFIFIDDNPVERETVKGECPEILVPDFPEDSSELISLAEEIWDDYCRPLRVLDEDLNKTKMYRNEAKRKLDMETSLSIDDYIKKLEIVVDIHKMQHEEKERVIQLIGKTNQFNLTTKRYTESEIIEFLSDPNYSIFVVHSADKYGDNGLISVIILKEENDYVIIDSFLMSCRVMGRKIEDVIINEIAAYYHKRLVGEYIATAKNVPVSDLYDRLGFILVSDKVDRKLYEMDASYYTKKEFNYFKEIVFKK